MSDLLDGSNDRLPAKDTPGTSLPNEPAVTLADFRFQKIGHPPALLQRMLASGSNVENSQRINAESRSPSPDLEDELLLSDSSPEALNNGLPSNNGQPSLRARIAMGEPPVEPSGNMDGDIPNQIQNYDPSTFGLRGTDGKSTGSQRPSTAWKPSTLTFPPSTTTSSENTNEHPVGSAATTLNDPSPFSGPSSIRRVPSSSQPAMHHTNPSQTSTSTSSETSTLKSLRDLQSLLSFSNLNSPSTDIADAMRLGQTIKDQCIEILSASRNAHILAQQSIASAQESLEASLKSLAVAESLQTRTDELIAVVKRMDSGRNEEWRNAIAPFATRLTQLVEDVKDQEISNAKVRRQTEREQKAAETQERVRSQHLSPVDTEVWDETSNLLIDNFTSRAEAEDALSRIKREATVASEELTRNREEAEARQRGAEEALRQRREAEDFLEQQRQQAQAELERLEERFKQAQTERMEAEEKERLRQEEDIRIMRMKEEEKQRKEEKAAQLVIEERNKRVALELQKQQAQQNKLAREAALREQLEKEKLAREQDAKIQAKEDEKDRLRQQELKHQEIRDQKIRTALEAAKKIQATRARNIQKSDLQTSETVLTNSSASVLSNVADDPLESQPSMSGGNVVAAAEHHTTSLEARSSLGTTPPTISSPPQQAAPHSSSVPPKHLPSSSKSRLSIGLPSPPLEENKFAQDHIVNDRARTIAESSALGIRRSHEAIAENQTYHNTNVGSLVHQPQRSRSPSKHSRSLEAVESEKIFVENEGHEPAELSLSSRSHTTPTSNARKSNLRKPVIKPELEESKFTDIKPTSLNVKVESMSHYNEAIVKTETPDKKWKVESPSDYHIPPLSMPSPSPDHGHGHNESLPTLPVFERETPKEKLPFNKRHILDPVEEPSLASRTNLPLPGRHHASNDRTLPTKAANQDIQTSDTSIALPSQSGSGSRVISSSLPAKPPPVQSIFQVPVNHGAILNTNFDDHRMGPDAAVPDNVFPPSHLGPMEEDLSEQRRRRVAPRVDHYSPSPPPLLNSNIRVVPARPRRGDHYSPRRSPEPRGSYGVSRTSPGPSWNRQRVPDIGPNSRDVSPGPPAQYRAPHNIRRSPSPERDAQSGRKRNRETQDAVGPPANRPRLGYADNNYPQIMHNPNAPDTRHQYEDDWSRTANYGRSPSPEPRLTPLVFRLEEAPNPVRLPVQRPEANKYPDQPRRRDAGSYARTASSSSDAKSNPPNNAHRQNMGDRPDGSRPHLLDRFTDLPMGGLPAIPSELSHQHSHYNKGPRYRKQTYQRPNAPQHQQPLEQRLNNKNSLINRLQQQ